MTVSVLINKMRSLVAFNPMSVIIVNASHFDLSHVSNKFLYYICSLIVVFYFPLIQKRMLLLTHALLFLLWQSSRFQPET